MKNTRAYKKSKKRIGRGSGSGHGKTACRGSKGYYSRTGSHASPGFEGGQMTFIRRLPKRGFNNTEFKKNITIVNLEMFEGLSEKEITPDVLMAHGILKCTGDGVKVLGQGKLTKAYAVHAQYVSEPARKKIEAAGGSVTIIKG